MAEDKAENNVKIYKKWWFWVIIILLLVIIAGNSSSIENSNSNNNTANLSENAIENKTKAKVTVIDFSSMQKTEIQNWGNENNMTISFKEEYSDTVNKGNFVSQSVEANSEINEGSTITITYSLGKEPSVGEKNALSKAKSYLNVSSFSYKGLINQLEYEGFSTEEAEYGVDNCGADWNEQAAKKAQSYMKISSFSKSGLIDQLEFEGFTTEQAEYGVAAVGY